VSNATDNVLLWRRSVPKEKQAKNLYQPQIARINADVFHRKDAKKTEASLFDKGGPEGGNPEESAGKSSDIMQNL